MRTGDTNERKGIYQGACCKQEIELDVGQTFPPCPECGEPTVWSMIRATRSAA